MALIPCRGGEAPNASTLESGRGEPRNLRRAQVELPLRKGLRSGGGRGMRALASAGLGFESRCPPTHSVTSVTLPLL